MLKKIIFIGSSRATYGYKKKILQLLKKDKKIKTFYIVTGMHLSKKHGYSINEIIKDRIPISYKLNMRISNNDSHLSFLRSLSYEMYKLSEIYNKINPDLVIVTGDRAEMLIAAITAAYMNIPIGHIQAGDLSGHIDGSARHSITKISHLHFASCKDSADRVIKMGEQKWRVFNTGAPQLDGLKDLSIKKTNKNLKKFGLIENEKFFLIIFHPVLYSSSSSSKQIQIILESLKNFKIKKFIIYPNIDTGYNDIINKIREYENKYNFVAFKNLKRDVFLSLLKKTTALIGNSSAGILEAPTFKIPVVNIGDRQRGRIQSDNIINCQLNKTAITNAINKIFLDKKFKNKLKKCQNLYGNGESSKKIVKILKNIKINKKLLDKEMTY